LVRQSRILAPNYLVAELSLALGVLSGNTDRKSGQTQPRRR